VTILTNRKAAGRWEPKRFHWWYDSLIDWMLTNPDKPLKEAAVAFSVTPNFIYMLNSSDLFRERFAERRSQINSQLHSEILDRTARVASKGLQEIEKRLDNQDVKKMNMDTLADVTDKALQRLGYGAPKGPQIVVNNTNVVETAASASAITAARESIRSDQFRRIGGEVEDQVLPPPHPLLDLSVAPANDEPELPLEHGAFIGPSEPPETAEAPELDDLFGLVTGGTNAE